MSKHKHTCVECGNIYECAIAGECAVKVKTQEPYCANCWLELDDKRNEKSLQHIEEMSVTQWTADEPVDVVILDTVCEHERVAFRSISIWLCNVCGLEHKIPDGVHLYAPLGKWLTKGSNND